MRIAKYLASCGLGSRRKCEEIIKAGKVKVNNITVTDLATRILPDDIVLVDGVKCETQNKVYYLVNKPVGYTSTVADPYAKKLITELVPTEPPVWPVGRLDKETSGLIILTNDGKLTQKLTHPSFQKEKEYLAKVTKELSAEELQQLLEGIVLEDGATKADQIERVNEKTYRIVIHEGRNRLVRRIFDHFKSEVIELTRIRIDGLNIDDLKTGEYKILTSVDLEKLNA